MGNFSGTRKTKGRVVQEHGMAQGLETAIELTEKGIVPRASKLGQLNSPACMDGRR
jgi:hypothetical protein